MCGLSFQNIESTNSHDDSADANQNKVDIRQICGGKYETEVAIRTGLGPPCLVLRLVLIGVAIWRSHDRNHRVGEWVCGCSSLAVFACSLAALCLPSYYDCDDYDGGSGANNPLCHANTVTQKYLLTTLNYCNTVM